MNRQTCLLIVLGLGACTTMRPVTKLEPATIPVPDAPSCADCPGQLIRVSPWQWPPFTLVRFFRNGRPLGEGAFHASRTPGDATLQWQLQFGNIYLLRGRNAVVPPRGMNTITCIQGRDTMQVSYLFKNGQQVAYDSIPFRAGRYLLSKPLNLTATYPLKTTYVSFAAYYQQHEADLARANPFADCLFNDDDINREDNPKRYVAATPADIFRLLLQHTYYERQVGYQLQPLARGGRPTH